MRSPRRSQQKEEPRQQKEEPLTTSALREQLNLFANETLQRELERLKASIVKELSQEIAQARAGVVQDLADKHAQQQYVARSPVVPALAHAGGGQEVGAGHQEVVAQSKELDSDLEKQDKQPLLASTPRTVSAGEQASESGIWASPYFKKLAEFVKSNGFDYLAGFFVFSSIVWLTWVTQYTATRWLAEPPRAFVWVEVFFCVVFSAELSMRLMVFGCRAFFWSSSDWQSNIFDFLLVVLQVLDTFLEVTGASASKLSWAPFIRILRLFRILRLIRIFRFFPELRMLVVSVVQSFQPLMWVFSLIFFITAVFAIVITVVVNEYKTGFSLDDWEKKDMMEQNLQEFFGSVERSVFTLYGTISGGRDWHTSAFPLMKFIDERLIGIFVLYTFFVIFAMMNVVTSQFVDSALEASAKDRRESMVSNLMDTFSVGSGLVTEDDFMRNLEDRSMKSFLKDLYKREEVSAQEIRHSRLFEMLDDDGSGAITKEELVLGCVKLTGAATSLDLAVLKLDVLETRKDIEQVLSALGIEKRNKSVIAE